MTTPAIRRLAAAVLSHRSAAQLWGLIRSTGPVKITAPTKRTRPAITLHRCRLTDAEITHHWGIPTTTAARTLQDLTAILDPASLTRAVNDARLAHLLNVADLPPRLRPTTDRPTRSKLEDAFVTFCKRHRLPAPEINATVAGYEVDAYWHPQRLIAELDGRDYHEHFETDRAKDADLLQAGFRVVRLTWERLTHHATREAKRFRVLLA